MRPTASSIRRCCGVGSIKRRTIPMQNRGYIYQPPRIVPLLGRIGKAMKIPNHTYLTYNVICIPLVVLSLISSATAQSVPPLINYQGKLTDQTGTPSASGVYTIQFRLWDSPTLVAASDLIWSQQQNTIVQSNGIFNVILGSPGGSPIPGDTPAVNNIAYAFSNSNCFLGLTVTASNGVTLLSPTEIIPRQQLLSVPFAFTAATANNATVAASVVPGGITAASLASNAVESVNIAPGAVQTASIASGAVTLTNLEPRQTGTNVGIGGIAVSGSCGYVNASGSYADVTNLTITLATSGRPVYVALIPDGSANESFVDAGTLVTGGGGSLAVAIVRDESVTNLFLFNAGSPGGSGGATAGSPPSAVTTVDFPPAGVHVYKVQVKRTSNVGDIRYCKLLGFEF